MKISHVAIIVSDIEQSIAFYESVLGFKLKSKTYRQERNSWKVNVTREGMELEIFTFPDAPKRPSYPEALGLRHLAFEVDDIEKCYREIKNKIQNVEDIRVDPENGKKFFFFTDPDDQPLEIYES